LKESPQQNGNVNINEITTSNKLTTQA